MQSASEIYYITITGIILGILLVGFIVIMVLLYKRRQQKEVQEMARIKDMYEKEVLRSQLEIQENTFKNISQELHDNIGQMLSVVRLSLSALPVKEGDQSFPLLKHSQQVLNKAITDLSDLTKSLHTERIADIGLADSIKYELASVKNAGLLEVEFSMEGIESPMREQQAVFLFRMFQEMLNNVLKHAKAKKLMVGIIYGNDGAFKMEIKDNGIGFDPEEKKNSVKSNAGVGLKSMVNRASLIGASMDMVSVKGQGTTITVELKPSSNEYFQNG